MHQRLAHVKTLQRNIAIVHLLAGAVMISFSGVWVKISHVTPTVSAFYRVLFGGLFLLIAACWQKEITWKGWQHLMLGFLCGVFLALDLFLWHQSIQYIGPGLATILGNFQVFLLTGLGVVFMGEKVSPRYFLAIVMAILGLFLVVGIQWNQLGSQYKTGVYLGLATAVAYTAFLLALRKLQAGEGGAELQPAGILEYVEDLKREPNAGVGPNDFFEIASNTFYGMMLLSFASAIILGLQAVYSRDSFVIPDIQSWAALLLLGLTSQGIGWILISNALPRVRASFAGLILLLQPSLAFIWDVLFFHRPTSTINWLGVIMAITAIYLGTTQKSDDR